MLTAFERDIAEIIKCALNGGAPSLSEGFDLESAYSFAQERQITPLVYYGLSNLPDFMDTVTGKKFFKSTMNLSFFCAEQGDAINTVLGEFRKNKIHHMPVKGTMVRNMYPYPEMRLMSDADILIKEGEYPKIKAVMESLGFVEQYESDHELVWKRGEFSIELHKRLVPSYNRDYYEYFGDGWRLASVIDESTGECRMSAEDDFIYNFIHYAMHYRNGGIGVKHVTDFYVIMQKNPTLDFEYIERELDRLGVLQFWKNTKRLLDVWFNSAESDDISDFLTTKIFNSGAYGTAEGKMNSEAVRISGSAKSAKLKVIMNVIFPTYKAMCQKYPFLKKTPVLLPFMWVFRWIVTLFQPSKIRAQKRNVDILSRESINNYHAELRYVGLDFNFE